MFIGHFAPAFVAAAAYSRGPRLATYFVAAQLVDWAFFSLALIGVEKMRIVPGATEMNPLDLYHMPYTHSLVGTAVFAIVFGIGVSIWRRSNLGGFVAALVVCSHWALDWAVHSPDLTIAGNGRHYGLGLWDRPEIAMPLELGLTLAAFVFYIKRSRGPLGQPLVLLAALLALQAINWFGPEPAEANAWLYLQALAAFAVVTGLAAWTAKNRFFVRRGGLAASAL